MIVAAAKLERLSHVVRYHNGGDTELIHDLAGQIEYQRGGGRIKRGGVFIEQQNLRRSECRHDQRQRLPLPPDNNATRSCRRFPKPSFSIASRSLACWRT